MKLELDETELTSIIKEAFVHYAEKPFGYAKFVQTEGGIAVQFYDAGSPEVESEETDDPRPSSSPTIEPESEEPRVALPDPFPFGGFGGGNSGGAGASGTW